MNLFFNQMILVTAPKVALKVHPAQTALMFLSILLFAIGAYCMGSAMKVVGNLNATPKEKKQAKTSEIMGIVIIIIAMIIGGSSFFLPR